jgi:ribosomal subunit interface protein
MAIPLHVTGHDVVMTETVDAALRGRVDKLEQFFDRVVDCRAILTGRRGKFDCRVILVVPSKELAVSRRHGTDVLEAVRVAFDALERQLATYVRRLRREGRTGSRISAAGSEAS